MNKFSIYLFPLLNHYKTQHKRRLSYEKINNKVTKKIQKGKEKLWRLHTKTQFR